MSDNKEKIKKVKNKSCRKCLNYKIQPETVLLVAFSLGMVEFITDCCYAVGEFDGNVSGNLFEEWKISIKQRATKPDKIDSVIIISCDSFSVILLGVILENNNKTKKTPTHN